MSRRCRGWTVLAAGPSLNIADSDDFLDGPIVACNRAIMRWEFKPLFWACNDRPDTVLEQWWQPLPWEKDEVPIVMTNKMHVQFWRDKFPSMEVTSFRHHYTGGWRAMTSTTTQAIAEAFYRGAQRVRVIGQDLDGHSYAFGGGDALEKRGRYEWRDELEDMEWLESQGLEILRCDNHSQRSA